MNGEVKVQQEQPASAASTPQWLRELGIGIAFFGLLSAIAPFVLPFSNPKLLGPHMIYDVFMGAVVLTLGLVAAFKK